MNPLVNRLLDDVLDDPSVTSERRALIQTLLEQVVNVAQLDTDTQDLRVAITAINELLAAFMLFATWRDRPKVTIFGSARTSPDDPLYHMASALAAAMAERGWYIVAGGGPGIMEAAARGAGVENTLGVNIDLPFEQTANDYVDAASRLITMKYFFTRKVALTRGSHAFAVLPGGLGTMDELFEVLTLLDTGKTTPAPVVLLDTPEGTYWHEWLAFLNEAVVTNGYVATDDLSLVRVVSTIDDAVDEIERFYSNFESFDVEDGRGLMTLHRTPSDAQLTELREAVPLFSHGEGLRLEGPSTISFDFDGRNYVSLRLVIDRVNGWES